VSESAARAVLLSSDLSGLTSGHCARIRARGVRVVGLAQDSWGGNASPRSASTMSSRRRIRRRLS
jgi:hypothetical protein